MGVFKTWYIIWNFYNCYNCVSASWGRYNKMINTLFAGLKHSWGQTQYSISLWNYKPQLTLGHGWVIIPLARECAFLATLIDLVMIPSWNRQFFPLQHRAWTLEGCPSKCSRKISCIKSQGNVKQTRKWHKAISNICWSWYMYGAFYWLWHHFRYILQRLEFIIVSYHKWKNNNIDPLPFL